MNIVSAIILGACNFVIVAAFMGVVFLGFMGFEHLLRRKYPSR